MVKKLILILALIMFMTGTALAITQEELESAKVTLRKMENSVRTMKGAVNVALRGNVVGIDLTETQINSLVQRYVTNKSELQTLYQELP